MGYTPYYTVNKIEHVKYKTRRTIGCEDENKPWLKSLNTL